MPGTPPKHLNTYGKVQNKTKAAPKGDKTNPPKPDVSQTHEYLDSVKPGEIKAEGERLSGLLKEAQANKDFGRATQIKDAMAGLKDKGVGAGLKAADMVSLDDGMAARIADAFDGAFSGPANRLKAGLKGMGGLLGRPGKKPATPTPAPAPAEGTGGGYSKGRARNEKGKCGEWLAKQDLHNDGFTDILEVQNNSGHGVDVIGRNANGDVRVLEVKTTDGPTAPPMRGDQASMGGKDFTDDRLDRAVNSKGHYANSPMAQANAKKAISWLESAKEAGKKVSYEKYDMFIEDPKEGCHKKDAKSSPWEKKTPKTRKR